MAVWQCDSVAVYLQPTCVRKLRSLGPCPQGAFGSARSPTRGEATCPTGTSLVQINRDLVPNPQIAENLLQFGYQAAGSICAHRQRKGNFHLEVLARSQLGDELGAQTIPRLGRHISEQTELPGLNDRLRLRLLGFWLRPWLRHRANRWRLRQGRG